MNAAKTNAERQREFRARQKAAGLKQVRNLWAKPEHHDKIKAYAALLTTPIKH